MSARPHCTSPPHVSVIHPKRQHELDGAGLRKLELQLGNAEVSFLEHYLMLCVDVVHYTLAAVRDEPLHTSLIVCTYIHSLTWLTAIPASILLC